MLPAGESIDALVSNLQGAWALLAPYAPWLLLGLFLIAVYRSPFGRRVRAVVQDLFFTNWQLMLLGTAALVLSLAGGWTTWDGMRNFTGEPVLSLMFTFGIHGVMLIVAWLIGESFATGMSSVPQRGYARVTVPLIAIAALAVLLLVVAGAAYQYRYGIPADSVMGVSAVAGLVLLAIALLTVFSGSDVVAPYAQALRIMARNAMLWVMFLACMSVSVFFSFDSRFNVVFPQEERKRVADLRAQNQVTGILADIEGAMNTRRLEQSQALFDSDGWKAYEPNLVKLAEVAQSAQGDIERYFVQQMEERRRRVAEQQERITTALGGQAGLANKKLSITDELTRLKGERPGLAAEYAQHKSELDAKQREVDAKRIEAMAEDRGVEGTGKQGKGPAYRERVAELARLQDAYKIKEERTKDAQKRLGGVETRIARIERELAGIDGEIAQMQGEAQTAEYRIKAVQAGAANLDGPKLDPARALLAFDNARTGFHQEPTIERLGQVHQLCTQVQNAMSGTPATKERVRDIDCDPRQANEAAAGLFALNAGFKVFQTDCAGGDKLAPHTTADALFEFARKCLADSGLPSKDTDALRTKISFTELTRDDRAHHFVVSWNAFGDGNRLAYLALAIAIGIDSLIFMTGLFGANAVRSPLSDVPGHKPRNAQQLEAVIENALLPDRFENANAVIDVMDPITPRDGFTAEVVLPPEETPGKRRIMKVLNAAATIGAVGRDADQPERYLVRGELFEFLSAVAKRAFESDKRYVNQAELERVVSVALLPEMRENAETVLGYMHPIREQDGFTSEIRLDEVAADHQRTVRSALNAGATLERVRRVGADAGHYYIHGDFYKTLARIRARLLISTAPAHQIGGPLRPDTRRLEARPAHAIEHGNGAAQRPLAIEEDRGKLLGELLDAIGLAPDSYGLITAPQVSGAAIAAGMALKRQGPPQTRLGEYLRFHESAWRSAIERARHVVGVRAGEGSAVARQADEVANEILKTLPALMLLPQSHVVAGLIEELESAAQDELPEEQQRLKDWLSQLQKDLLRSDLSSTAGWHRAQAMIENYLIDSGDSDLDDPDQGHKLPN